MLSVAADLWPRVSEVLANEAAMFVVICRWKLKPGSDAEFAEFREAWRQATQAVYAKCGSLGS
jgi:hypothetical protein